MKFWVKAIVDDDVQEQLFVEADSTEDLRRELESLLSIPIASLSIHDFNAQVRDRLEAGEDIITVKIRKGEPVSRRNSLVGGIGGRPLTTAAASTVDPSCAASAEGSFQAHYGGDISVEADWRPFSVSRDGGFAGTFRTSLPSPALSPPDTERQRPSVELEGQDRMNVSLGSAQFLARSGQGMGAGGAPDADVLGVRPVTPFKPQGLADFPQVQRLWLSRDDVEVLLTRQFKGKFKSVLGGCFVRTRNSHGYSFYQVQHVEKGHHGKIVLDTVYGTEAVSLETISNAEPSKDEMKRWVKAMLNTDKSFPTPHFIEAKHGDVQSALGSARAVLAGSPLPEETLNGDNNNGGATMGEDGAALSLQSLDAAALSGTHAPPSPVFSEADEAEAPSSRTRRPAVRGRYLGCAVRSSKVLVKANDLFCHTSVRVQRRCLEVAAGGGAAPPAPDASSSMEASLLPSSLVLFGTRHSNPKARKARQSDFSGFKITFTGKQSSTETTPAVSVVAGSPGRDQGPPRPPPLQPQFLPEADSAVAGSLATLSIVDRDITEKGFALFGAPELWHGSYVCLAHSRPDRDASARPPYARTTPPLNDSNGELAPGETIDSARPQFIQDFDFFCGPTADALDHQPQLVSLPIPPWALLEGREVCILHPTLVEHTGALHCFYLVRMSNGEDSEVRAVPRPASAGHRRSSRALVPDSPQPAAARPPPHRGASAPNSPATALRSLSFIRSAEDPMDHLTADVSIDNSSVSGEVEAASGAAAGGPTSSFLGASLERGARSLGSTPALPETVVQPFSYGLVHAVMESSSALATSGVSGEAAAAVARGRWRVVNGAGPLVESAAERPPLFAVASAPVEGAAGWGSGVVRIGGRTVHRDSLDATNGGEGGVGGRRELNLLWHNPPSPAALTPPQRTLPGVAAQGLFGCRPVLCPAASTPGRGGASTPQTLSPAVSRRRSPAVVGLHTEHSLGGRVEVPFRRFANADAATGAEGWVEDAYFAAVEVDMRKLVHGVESLSLFSHEGQSYLATVSMEKGRVVVWTLPITGEP